MEYRVCGSLSTVFISFHIACIRTETFTTNLKVYRTCTCKSMPVNVGLGRRLSFELHVVAKGANTYPFAGAFHRRTIGLLQYVSIKFKLILAHLDQLTYRNRISKRSCECGKTCPLLENVNQPIEPRLDPTFTCLF